MTTYTVNLTVHEQKVGNINYTAVTVDQETLFVSGDDPVLEFTIQTPGWTWMPEDPYGFYMFGGQNQFSTPKNALSNNNQTLTVDDVHTELGVYYYCCCVIKQPEGETGPTQAAATDPIIINTGTVPPA